MLELIALARAPKEIKKEGYIPAVFYGAKTVSTPVFISPVDFQKVFSKSGEMSTISLKTEQGVKNVLVHDMQRHPVKNTPIHVDFYVVEKGQKVHVAIPLTFSGEAPVAKVGGNVIKVAHELAVLGESHNLPQEFVIDLGALTSFDSVITAKDVALPKGVELYHVNPDDVLVTVVAQNDAEIEPVQEIDLSAIEVEKKGKKEEEGEAETN